MSQNGAGIPTWQGPPNRLVAGSGGLRHGCGSVPDSHRLPLRGSGGLRL